MTYKIVRDAAGKVVCFGPNNGMYEPALNSGDTVTIESAPPVIPPTYQELRVQEYPSIGDQLDALFHAGVFPDDMAATIQAVKDKYPKGA